MHKLSAVAALVAALQSADAAARPLFVCPSCDPSAADTGDGGGVIRVRGGGGMGGGGGGMRLGGGGMGSTSGGMGGTSGGMGGLFDFHQPDCPEHHPKSASRHTQSKLSSCSN